MPTKATRSSGQKPSARVKATPVSAISTEAAEQQAAPGQAVGVEADEEGEDRGAGQGRGRDQADLERAVPEGGEVGRQQQADQPVAEGAQGPRGQQQPGLGRGARREQARRPTASSSRPRPAAASAPQAVTPATR